MSDLVPDLQERVRLLVAELFLGGDLSSTPAPETDLLAAGICDSLGLVRLAARLEETFEGLTIQDQDITPEKLGSIAAIGALVRHGTPS